MKKNWTKLAIAIGPVILIASVVWEYARVNPSYNFLVEPWAIRGYESDHGLSFAILGLILLVGGLATAWEGALRDATSAAVAAYFVVAATVFTFVFVERDISITMSPVFTIVLTVMLAAAVAVALRGLLGERIRIFKRLLVSFVVVAALFTLLFQLTVVGDQVTLAAWIWVLIIMLILAALSVAIRPVNMAANRLLILASVAAWGAVLLSAGAIRAHLIETQLTTVQPNGAVGVSAQYKDTQAAFGWWLAGFGTFVLFVGAVGLWAKRRDIVAALARARKQRAAAEKSAKEIADAAEAYAKEQAAREQAVPPQA